MSFEVIDDLLEDVLGEVLRKFDGAFEGPPMAYFEYLRDLQDGEADQQVQRFVYVTFSYDVRLPVEPKQLASLRDMMVAELVSLRAGMPNAVLAWRYVDRIRTSLFECKNCGKSVSIRARAVAVPQEIRESPHWHIVS